MGLRRKQVSSRNFEGRGVWGDDLYWGHLFRRVGLSETGALNCYNEENQIKIIPRTEGAENAFVG